MKQEHEQLYDSINKKLNTANGMVLEQLGLHPSDKMRTIVKLLAEAGFELDELYNALDSDF